MQVRVNFASGTLGTNLSVRANSDAGYSETVANFFTVAPNLATLAVGDWYKIIIDGDDPSKSEIVYITAYTSGSRDATITRGREQTLAVAHNGGGSNPALWMLGPTARDFDGLTYEMPLYATQEFGGSSARADIALLLCLGSNRRIHFSYGTYVFDSTMPLSKLSNLHITGDGAGATVLQSNAAHLIDMYGGRTLPCENNSIENLTLAGYPGRLGHVGTQQNVILFSFFFVRNLTVFKVEFKDSNYRMWTMNNPIIPQGRPAPPLILQTDTSNADAGATYALVPYGQTFAKQDSLANIPSNTVHVAHGLNTILAGSRTDEFGKWLISCEYLAFIVWRDDQAVWRLMAKIHACEEVIEVTDDGSDYPLWTGFLPSDYNLLRGSALRIELTGNGSGGSGTQAVIRSSGDGSRLPAAHSLIHWHIFLDNSDGNGYNTEYPNGSKELQIADNDGAGNLTLTAARSPISNRQGYFDLGLSPDDTSYNSGLFFIEPNVHHHHNPSHSDRQEACMFQCVENWHIIRPIWRHVERSALSCYYACQHGSLLDFFVEDVVGGGNGDALHFNQATNFLTIARGRIRRVYAEGISIGPSDYEDAGKARWKYTEGNSISDVEISECGSHGIFAGSPKNLTVRNVKVHHNGENGIRLTGGPNQTATGGLPGYTAGPVGIRYEGYVEVFDNNNPEARYFVDRNDPGDSTGIAPSGWAAFGANAPAPAMRDHANPTASIGDNLDYDPVKYSGIHCYGGIPDGDYAKLDWHCSGLKVYDDQAVPTQLVPWAFTILSWYVASVYDDLHWDRSCSLKSYGGHGLVEYLSGVGLLGNLCSFTNDPEVPTLSNVAAGISSLLLSGDSESGMISFWVGVGGVAAGKLFDLTFSKSTPRLFRLYAVTAASASLASAKPYAAGTTSTTTGLSTVDGLSQGVVNSLVYQRIN